MHSVPGATETQTTRVGTEQRIRRMPRETDNNSAQSQIPRMNSTLQRRTCQRGLMDFPLESIESDPFR
jgi:hypothetical protein